VHETTITFEIEPPSARDFARRIDTCASPHPQLVAVSSQRIAGHLYTRRFSLRAAYHGYTETTAYLDRDFHRQGIGRRLYGALIGLLREQGHHSLHAGVTLLNEASIGLHRAIGMADVGVYREAGFKADRWHDVG